MPRRPSPTPTKKVLVVLPEELLREVDRVAGRYRRSAWIRKVLAAAVAPPAGGRPTK